MEKYFSHDSVSFYVLTAVYITMRIGSATVIEYISIHSCKARLPEECLFQWIIILRSFTGCLVHVCEQQTLTHYIQINDDVKRLERVSSFQFHCTVRSSSFVVFDTYGFGVEIAFMLQVSLFCFQLRLKFHTCHKRVCSFPDQLNA